MLTTRIVAGNDSAFSYVRIKYGSHSTDTVTGVIIYPDDFSFADAGAPMLQFGAHAPVQIEKADWEAFEAWGCVFLPGAGRVTLSTGGVEYDASQYMQNSIYWSCTAFNASQVRPCQFWIMQTNPNIYFPSTPLRSTLFSVRLVQDYY